MTSPAVLLTALLAAVPAQERRPTFAASVEAVYLDVFVVHDGRPLPGLAASDFEVRDNGVRQEVRIARQEDLPLTAVLVFDASASVRGEKLAHLQAAGRALLAGLRDRDEAALVAFSHELGVVVAQGRDRSAVRRALDRLMPGGATALWDALYAGLKIPRARGRPMVVLFTDGEDNMSWLSPPQVQKVAEESEALVYVVTLAGPEEVTFTVHGREVKHTEGPAARALRQVAEATGGRLWTVSASSDLEPTFLRILAEMQSRYLLSYEPSGVASQGWHRLEVKLKGRRGTVRSRRGYFVPPRAAGAPEPLAR